MKRSLIRIIDIRNSHQLENQFIEKLSEHGLIEVIVQENEEFLDEEQLSALEQYVDWYYELEINIQGIAVAQQLLLKIDQLQQEVNRLR